MCYREKRLLWKDVIRNTMAKHRNWLHMVQLKFFFSRLLNLLSKQNILLTIMLRNTYTFKILKSILELCVKF